MTVTVRLVAWERADEGRGHSMARMEELPDGWLFHGTEVLIEPATTLSYGFRILLDTEGQTREVDVASVSAAGEVRLSLRVDDERRWWRNGEHDPELDGCLDVDVAATPLTNTFPIRRYEALAVGESVTTAIAWVDVPSLEVSRVDQTYRRLERDRWHYGDPTHGGFDLTVDGDGLVVDYEGFAVRIR